MLIIGSAQAVNIAISIFRQKALAVLLGPTGIGLLSIYNNLMTMTAQGAGLGMSSSGVREIASVRDDPETLARVRKVLLSAHLAQGCLALIALWLLREQIAIWLFGDEGFALQVGLVGFAVAMSLLASAHTALLQGLRRIGDLGRVTVIGALFGTAAGLSAVWLFGQDGLIWFLLVQPLCNLIVARWFVGLIRTSASSPPALRDLPRICLPMSKLGFTFMVGGLATGMTLLVLRRHISTQLRLEAAGHFAAAWASR
ncbi:oligosaccharide flippase family protein [Tropicimonas sp. IMCC34011]|uniref:oligosaccharide flippase family protein n=1 Tax=Tropicimonas sp. IMCC34011 TaxID=2248759 RepID=UPI001300586E|nr:oligosaccharide flippase family protein [Tropicimonas sp. IMCC34011]